MTEATRPSDSFDAMDEARATLDAIAAGHVDAVVVHGPHGPQVFHLEGPDQPFRTFVENMQEGAITVSAEGIVLYANGYFARLLGMDVDSIIGASLRSLVPSTYQATLMELIEAGMNQPVRGQLRLRTRGGGGESEDGDDSIPVQLTLSPLGNASTSASCGLVFDLREREGVERAHAALLAAEQASVAKDQFLAVVSHELRSPLNAILGWAQLLLQEDGIGESVRRAAVTIERNARTQAQLIGDLLDISRIVAGKLNLEMGNVDLGGLTEAAMLAARPAAESRRLELRYASSDELDVYGDPTRLQQIVTNLLNNSIKFTEEGGRIQVALERDGNEAVLRVTDTGVGIKKEMLSRVFDPFQQAGTQQSRRGGLGLGLAIARQLANAHGGDLTVSSEGQGSGSTFTLRLPLVARSARPPASDLHLNGALTGARVLAVDDERDSRDFLSYLLERAGAQVTAVGSAKEALSALAQSSFDLMISDIGLDDQDGLQLMREVRARGYSSLLLPAIALTGYAAKHDAHLVTAAGYQRHLAKPADAAVLINAALELLRKRLG
jgi:PAS domain S-box-containing protein